MTVFAVRWCQFYALSRRRDGADHSWLGMLRKPTFCSDSDFKNRTVQKFDVCSDGFQIETACNPPFKQKANKSNFTCIKIYVQIKKRFKTRPKHSLAYRFYYIFRLQLYSLLVVIFVSDVKVMSSTVTVIFAVINYSAITSLVNNIRTAFFEPNRTKLILNRIRVFFQKPKNRTETEPKYIKNYSALPYSWQSDCSMKDMTDWYQSSYMWTPSLLRSLSAGCDIANRSGNMIVGRRPSINRWRSWA